MTTTTTACPFCSEPVEGVSEGVLEPCGHPEPVDRSAILLDVLRGS